MEQRTDSRINNALRQELDQEGNRTFNQRMKISALEQRCQRVEKLLKQLPPEVLKQIKEPRGKKER